MRRYLNDFAIALKRDHLLRWEKGLATNAELEAEARGRIATLAEIADMEVEFIQQFYNPEPEPAVDA